MHRFVPAALTFVLLVWHSTPYSAVVEGRAQVVAADASTDVRTANQTIERMLRSGELQVRLRRDDTLLPGRIIEQLEQRYETLRVWGGGVSRQSLNGEPLSIFGVLYSDINLNVVPRLTLQAASQAASNYGMGDLTANIVPELMVLPVDGGAYRLVWICDVVSASDAQRLFLDANDGTLIQNYTLRETQAPDVAVGHGKGVLGDDKKISATVSAGVFFASDPLRPPVIQTFDMRANRFRMDLILAGLLGVSASDLAVDTDNEWTDGTAVDAHVYEGLTYDYYYKRFGRRGLDNANKRILGFVHIVRQQDVLSVRDGDFSYWNNAFYDSQQQVMVYGEGVPQGIFFTNTGKHVDPLAGAIDVVAHELTHGVTQFTSNLAYVNESGALNESFSDIMGTSVEFFYQPPGSGLLHADYLLGEDVFRAAVAGARDGIRSMENPALFDQPDHYSRRAILPLSSDNGGVHVNSSIPNQAFYLAIEGGTNRTSGLRVQGVGASNREQIEKVFYRAFAQLMPSNANFALARTITLTAAQDLYGLNSAPFIAVRDAWTAVGVN